MAKNPKIGEDIHIAPGITGKRDFNGALVIIDDKTKEKERLYPKANIEHKIRIFERQVNGWFLERVSIFLGEEDNGFIVLMIATAYIEGVEQCRKGESSSGESKTFFKNGVKRIFRLESCFDNRLNNFYSELRCGLFHNGMTGANIRIFSRFERPIDFLDNGTIEINQRLFLEKVKDDFRQYLTDLRDTTNTELRNNFKKMYTFT